MVDSLTLEEGRTRSGPRVLLVGSDLSPASDTIIQHAAAIARAGEGALHVVSAYPPPVHGFGDAPAEVPEPVLQEVRDALPAQVRRILPESSWPRSLEVRFGSPASVILERAREVQADTIVLGPHRGADVHANFLGTTADEVLRFTTVPCLTLRGPLSLPLHRVGLATDFSAGASMALDCTLAWAESLGTHRAGGEETEINVVSVAPSPDGTSSDAAGRLRDVVREARARLPAGEVRTTAEVLVNPDVASTVARWAERTRLDLLVVGTFGQSNRGRRGPGLGSISSALARRAPCPVLFVPIGSGRGE
jgi:nucleotide-binding universal stress UspA family protein